jgi:pimeloyl-ACP methyl ester carboxylesterase
MPRTSAAITTELHALLSASGERPPYVLVGHSFGGYDIRVYTAGHPADVSGLVFVDASQEDEVKYTPPAFQKSMDEQIGELKKQRRVLPWALFFGIARWNAEQDSSGDVTMEFLQKLNYLELTTKFFDAVVSESESLDSSREEVRASGNLGDRPVIVLTAGKGPEGDDVPEGVSPQELKTYNDAHIHELQTRLVRLSARGKQVVVPDSSHVYPSCVLSSLRFVRYGSPPKPPTDLPSPN